MAEKKVFLQTQHSWKNITYIANSTITFINVKQSFENLLKCIFTCVTFLSKIIYYKFVKNNICVTKYFKYL